MRTGNYIKHSHVYGKGWEVSVSLAAVDDEAYEKAKQTIREMVGDEDKMQVWSLADTPDVRSD